MVADTPRLARLREIEVWIARVRLGAVVFAVLEVGVLSADYPPGYENYAWITTAVFGVGALIHMGTNVRRAKAGFVQRLPP